MRYKTPIEIRSSQNIRVRVKLTELPEKLRCRIPAAEWFEDAQSFDRGQFIAETINFIDSVYAIEPQCYETILLMLADAMQNYIDCDIGIAETGGLVIGDKINPLVLMQFDLTKTIIKLMRELGLTPASRLPATPAAAKTIYDLLPFGK
jgi:phage terminase small subunit